MKNKKTLAVIGGGMSGLVASYLLSKKYEISLFEISRELGGITSDFLIEDEIYFSGCHQLVASKWLKQINKNNCLNLEQNKINYGNFTEIENNMKNFDWDYALPSINFKIHINKKKDIKFNNLNDRINFYPKIISRFLKNWLKHQSNLDIKKLISENSVGLGMSKVALKKNIDQIKNLKQNYKNYDDLYGIKDFINTRSKQRCYIPKNGYDFLFKIFKNKLLKKKVKIYNKTPVKPVWEKQKLYLFSKGQKLKFDKIIWTGNPVALIRNYGFPKLESMNIKTKIYCGNLSVKISDCFYIQVFSKKTKITRIYIYKIKNITKFTIETFDNENNEDVIKSTIKILKKFEFKFKPVSKIYTKKIKRFFLVSLNDDRIISQFLKKTKKTNLLTFDWRTYGREERIEKIQNF